MNTTTTTTTTSITRFALGTAFAALCFGAAACGTGTTAAPASLEEAASQQQSRTSPRAAEQQDLAARERAERADAKRWARGHETSEHPHGSEARPGSNKFPDLLP